MARATVVVFVRCDPDLRLQLIAEAERNARSLNQEVEDRLERSLGREITPAEDNVAA